MFTLFGMIGLVIFDATVAASGGNPTDLDLLSFQWCATMVFSLMMALVPVSGAMECRKLAAGGTAMRSSLDRVPSFIVAIIGVAIVIALMVTIGHDTWTRLLVFNNGEPPPTALLAWLLTVCACFSFVFTTRGLLCICRAWFRSFRVVSILLLAVLWILVPAADLSVASSRQLQIYDPIVTTFASGQSPLGTIILLWTELQGPVVAGVIGHVIVAVVVTLLSFLPRFRPATRTHRDQPDPGLGVPPVGVPPRADVGV